MLITFTLAVLASVTPPPAIVALPPAAEWRHVTWHALPSGEAAARRHAR